MNLQTFVPSYFSPYGGSGPDGGKDGFISYDDFGPYGGSGFVCSDEMIFRPQGGSSDPQGGLRYDSFGGVEVVDTSLDDYFVIPRHTEVWTTDNFDDFLVYFFFNPRPTVAVRLLCSRDVG